MKAGWVCGQVGQVVVKKTPSLSSRRRGRVLRKLSAGQERLLPFLCCAIHPNMSAPIKLLIINPNSTRSITAGLEEALNPVCPPGVELTFYTAPAHAPPSINDFVTASLTGVACYEDIVGRNLTKEFDGFLVCCCQFPPPSPPRPSSSCSPCSVKFSLGSPAPAHAP